AFTKRIHPTYVHCWVAPLLRLSLFSAYAIICGEKGQPEEGRNPAMNVRWMNALCERFGARSRNCSQSRKLGPDAAGVMETKGQDGDATATIRVRRGAI